jgi:ATP-binding cassette subfamily B protein
MRYRRKLDYKRFTQTAAEQSNLIELITGMQDIKLSNTEKQKRWNWERIQIKLFNISIKGLAIEQYQQVGTLFFTQTTSLLILFMAAKLVVSGSISIGMMMAISYIVGQLGGPISQVIGFIQTTQDAKISLERLNEIQNKEDEDVNTVNRLKYLPEDKELKLNNIKFTYDGSNRNYIINDVNLIIPGNKVTAIVGASGSGKTTLIKIMLGFYAPNSGNVMMGDTDIQEINSHILRQNIGAVLQDSFIFSDTIVKNITMEEDNINKEQLLKAVEIANIRTPDLVQIRLSRF